MPDGKSPKAPAPKFAPERGALNAGPSSTSGQGTGSETEKFMKKRQEPKYFKDKELAK